MTISVSATDAVLAVDEASAVWLSGALWQRDGGERDAAIRLARRVERALVEDDPAAICLDRPDAALVLATLERASAASEPPPAGLAGLYLALTSRLPAEP